MSEDTDLHLQAPSLPVLVIGVGNDDRGDDAVGLLVARRLRRRAQPGVTVLECGGAADELMEAWQGTPAVILIDAVIADARPGTILQLDALVTPLPADLFTCSTHAFGVVQAIKLAGALSALPPRMTLIGIVGKSWAPGALLSDAVRRALPAMERVVLGAVKAMRLADPS